MTECMPRGKMVRITVLKKTFNQDFVDAYTSDDVDWKPAGCCHAFDIGHEWLTEGHIPEGFPDWAWGDIHKYVMTLARGGNMLGVQPGKYVTCCTDGFRPVFYLLERVEDAPKANETG